MGGVLIRLPARGARARTALVRHGAGNARVRPALAAIPRVIGRVRGNGVCVALQPVLAGAQ